MVGNSFASAVVVLKVYSAWSACRQQQERKLPQGFPVNGELNVKNFVELVKKPAALCFFRTAFVGMAVQRSAAEGYIFRLCVSRDFEEVFISCIQKAGAGYADEAGGIVSTA